ncbi:CapA family protein [Fibrobacter succinogenes]|nr:CapA family protein [Fibrobacter succinogenes]
MSTFDFRIGTLECAIGNHFAYDERKMAKTKAIVYARDEDLAKLQEMNINLVTLANNHFSDLGLEGMVHTIELLSQKGILFCGAGKNFSEARKPAVIKKDGQVVAFIGCCFHGFAPMIFHPATDTEFGIYQTTIEEIQQNISELKKSYDKVVVLPHWAEEHVFIPPSYCYEYAKKMIDAGADAIIGSHPHVINPHTKYKGKDIFFSLGNFLFPDICMDVPRPMFYPASLNGLEKIWAYPKKVENKSLVIWKSFNRIGMIAEIQIDHKIKSRYTFVSLSPNNILGLYYSFLLKLHMSFCGFLVKAPFYGVIRKLYNHRMNVIRRLMIKQMSLNVPVNI